MASEAVNKAASELHSARYEGRSLLGINGAGTWCLFHTINPDWHGQALGWAYEKDLDDPEQWRTQAGDVFPVREFLEQQAELLRGSAEELM